MGGLAATTIRALAAGLQPSSSSFVLESTEIESEDEEDEDEPASAAGFVSELILILFRREKTHLKVERAERPRLMSEPANREETIFEHALGLESAEAREAYVREACGEDLALRERLLGLLHAHARAGRFLDPRPLAHEGSPRGTPDENGTVREATATEEAGDRIGRYKLLQKTGEGGCGIVYMAEQHEPVRRRVALKVIKLGMDTRHVVARFEAERQALALMDHPNIPRVFDGGTTETGRPYFVMELVRGVRITEYCDQRQLSVRERLELFIAVCCAIQHAHQKGIVHRDLKPSNILVMLHDDKPVPKVIDFGIAKALEQPLTDKTVFTAFEQFIGTPAYMSPEQAGLSGLDIDTRSDIYSLGVLLYELLTGRTPFESKELRKWALTKCDARFGRRSLRDPRRGCGHSSRPT